MSSRIIMWGVAVALAASGTALQAQDTHKGYKDPSALKHADSRQYRGEPAGNAKQRMTRCTITGKRDQQGRTCGQPTKKAGQRSGR